MKDVDNERIDLEATLDDPRNWKGAAGQKDQALVRQIIRQLNADSPTTGTQKGFGVISLAKIKAQTGMNHDTARNRLEDLYRRGVIDLAVERPGKPDAVWRAGLRLPVSAWPLDHIHRWKDPEGRL
jgi:hypothetical protein